MNNIFENAKFGDRFRTRDGRMAIYLGKDCCQNAIMLYNFNPNEYPFAKPEKVSICDGMMYMFEHNNDIVSRWEEIIDEEELDKLAIKQRELCHAIGMINFDATRSEEEIIEEIFKAGYRAAKQK